MAIPVQACTREGKPGYKYGQAGHCYTYTRGDEKARKRAKQQAYIQGAAIESHTGEDELSKAVDVLLEKYNHNHGPNGRFAPTGGGGGGGGAATAPAAAGGRNSDLPSWMEEKPKPEAKPTVAPVQVTPTKPEYKPWVKLPDNTYLPDSDGKYPFPDNAKARLDLKPLVGQERKIEYWAENPGGRSLTKPELRTRCIKDIKVEGVKAPIHHVWAQEPSKELMSAKWGQVQSSNGVITAYAKGKHGEPKTMDYSAQPRGIPVNKEMPLLDADTLLKDLGHLLEKYNHNHAANGRFAPSTGGATAHIGGVQSLEDALAGKTLEELPAPTGIEVTDGEVVNFVDNQLGVSDEVAMTYAKEIDTIAGNAKLQNMNQVTIKELAPQVLAQCEGSWENGGAPKLWNEVIAVNPHAKDYAVSRYVEDHMALQASGKMPWLASAYAPDAEKGYKAVLVHEVAHAKCMEHVMRKGDMKEWADPNNPMMGTKGWANTVNEAHMAGWQGPSQYGRKNLGECFAESVSLLTIRGTTGNKKVDDYVVRVIQE
jgi:hypothetical protein